MKQPILKIIFRRNCLLVLSLSAQLISTGVFSQMQSGKLIFKQAAAQVDYMLSLVDSIKRNGLSPELVCPRTSENGKLKMVKGQDWTSGFFPGELWLLYEQTKDNKWLAPAKQFTEALAEQQYFGGTHDLGFMIYCSYGNGYRLTGDTNYRKVILQAARTLSKRFNKATGVIKSWDNTNKWKYPVIIDNMMNLELLFEATRLSNDSSFYKIAVSHANTTIKNHFRDDFSSFHVIDYDPVTGAVRQKNTAQGFSDSSAWARGQAWGLYGYTMCYRETGDAAYLDQAKKIAAYILKRLPGDMIPYWDYDAPDLPNQPRDASAAAITASALYELCWLSGEKKYKVAAGNILKQLSTRYRSPQLSGNGFILLHSTGHKPAGSEVDVPLIYADYYYLEALMRSQK